MAKNDKEKTEKQFFGDIDEILIDENGEEYNPNSRSRLNNSKTEKQTSNEKIEKEKTNDDVEETEDTEVTENVEETNEQELNESEVIAAITESVEEKQKIIAKTFAQKMLEADSVIQDRYDELKNYACRFKKLKSRISRKFDSVNQGRLQFVKLTVAGKTLKLFLNMDIANADSKFHCKDMSDKKTYVTVPVLLRIKSGRAVRYAKILIDRCAEQHGLVENKKYQEVDAISLIEEFIASKNNDVESEVAISEE